MPAAPVRSQNLLVELRIDERRLSHRPKISTRSGHRQILLGSDRLLRGSHLKLGFPLLHVDR
jgi:hypothetical protein